MHTYNRRPFPVPGAAKAFLDPELDSIQRAIKDTQAAVSALPAGPSAIVLAANVSNSVAATNQGTGLKATVTAGKVYLFRWTVFISSNTNTGGAVLKVTHPAYTTGFIHARGNTTNATTFGENEPTVGASPTTVNASLAPYVAYSGTGVVVIEHTCTPSASGTVELTLSPNTNTQNYTVLAGSVLEAFST